MSAWETPTGPSRRRSTVVATAVGLCLLAATVAALASSGHARQLAVEAPSATPAPPTAEAAAVAWPPPWPGLWRLLPPSPLTSRVGHALLVTGRRLMVWGGADALGRPLTDGAVFDLATGRWRRLPGNGTRNSRVQVVWTGVDVVTVSTTETRRYDPRAGAWRTAARVPTPGGLLLGGQVRVAGSTVVTLLVAPDGSGASAVFALDAGHSSWRRLPDPPVPLQPGDLLLADADRLLVGAPGRAGRPGAVAGLRLDAGASGWSEVASPPGFTSDRVGRLSGVLDGDRVLLWGTGPGTDGETSSSWAAVRERGSWVRIDAGPLGPSRLVDVIATGDGALLWDRINGQGALRRWTSDRWTRMLPAPLEASAPRPAAWTGSGVAVWGGFDGSGGVFTPR
jgi:hypothetical protein